MQPVGGTIAAAIAAIAAIAAAGPEWTETDDAGETTTSAQEPAGTGPLGAIKGNLLGSAGPETAGLPDFQDVFQIYVRDPAGFAARTVEVAGPQVPTRLFLFRPGAFGVVANEQDPAEQEPLSRLLSVPDDLGFPPVTEPGIYFIAVSNRGFLPVDAAVQDIFVLAPPIQVSGPDGSGGAMPFAGWRPDPPGAGAAGPYRILFSPGTVDFPPCPGDVDADGDVDIADLNAVLAGFGGPGIFGDANADGVIDIADLNLVLANFGSAGC